MKCQAYLRFLAALDGRGPVSLAYGDSLAGCAEHDGWDAVDHRHLWDGGVLRQQASAGVGNSCSPRCAADRSVAGIIGTGS